MMYAVITCLVLLSFFVWSRVSLYRIIGQKIAFQEVQITRNVLATNLYTKKKLQTQYPAMYELIAFLGTQIDLDAKAFIDAVVVISAHDRRAAALSTTQIEHQIQLQQELSMMMTKDKKLYNEYYDFHLSVFKAKKPLKFIGVKMKVFLVIVYDICKTFSSATIKTIRQQLHAKKLVKSTKILIETHVREDMQMNRNEEMLVRL